MQENMFLFHGSFYLCHSPKPFLEYILLYFQTRCPSIVYFDTNPRTDLGVRDLCCQQLYHSLPVPLHHIQLAASMSDVFERVIHSFSRKRGLQTI